MREPHAVVGRELVVVLVALAVVERQDAQRVLDVVEQPDLLVLLDDARRNVLPRDTERLVAAVERIDIHLAVVETADLLPVLRLVQRLVPLRAALHGRLVGFERAVPAQARHLEHIRDVPGPVAAEIGMAVCIARRLARSASVCIA